MTKKYYYTSLVVNLVMYLCVLVLLFSNPFGGLAPRISILVFYAVLIFALGVVVLFIAGIIMLFSMRDKHSIKGVIINAVSTFIILGMAYTLLAVKPIYGQQFSFNQDTLNLRLVNETFALPYLQVQLDKAWNFLNSKSVSSTPVSIVVLDTGVDSQHQEFKSPDVSFMGSEPNALLDHDAAGGGHGTEVSGIIGANNISATSSANYRAPQMNGVISGVTGLKYALNEKYIGSTLFTTLTDIVESPSNSIINLSSIFQISSSCPLTRIAVGIPFRTVLAVRPDVLLVVSAGETPPDDASCSEPGELGAPTAFLAPSNVINVGGLAFDGQGRWVGSPSGSAVNITAPAVDVYTPSTLISTPPGDKYDPHFSGTSASTPMVTGVAAILKALEPEYQKYNPGLAMTPAKIKEILVFSADPIPTDQLLGQGCFNQATEKGCRLNAHRAVAWLFPPASSTLGFATSTSNSITFSWTKGDDFQNPDFASYKLFRSASPNVTTNSTLVVTLTDPNQISFADTDLTPNTTFFYKLFVFDKAGLSAGSNEVSAATLPASPPPTPVSIQFFYPSYNIVGYFGIGWSRNADANFASYRIFRATHPDVTEGDTLVTTLTNQNQVFYKDADLVPGVYFYKVFVFNQSGIFSSSDEVGGKVFTPAQLVSRIPGVPEPGDTDFPADVAIPTYVFDLPRLDCPRSAFDFFACTGPFTGIGPNFDEHGHIFKFRRFPVVSIVNSQLNGQDTLKFNMHLNDLFNIIFFAQDRDYRLFIPAFGMFADIQQGQTKTFPGQAVGVGTGSFDIIVQADTQSRAAGMFTIVP